LSLFNDTTLKQRQANLAAAFGDGEAIVLVGAGEPLAKPGGWDQTYPFRPHPEYYWLTGLNRPGGVLAYSPQDGWTHFVVPVSDSERLWTADGPTPEGRDIAELTGWLDTHSQHPVVCLGVPFPGVSSDPVQTPAYQMHCNAVRRRKDAAEIALVRRAAEATAAGYAHIQSLLCPGITERLVQIELETAMFRAGADGVGYETIVGFGPRAAVLHGQPSDALARPDDVVLIDAGGEIGFYTADVTRTYSAGGRFTPEQHAIYDIVLAAELAGIDGCRIGVEWHDVHRTAAAVIATGLRDLGILKCSVDEALDAAAVWMFFPHGIGHTVGLGVRDVGGHAPDRPAGRQCCGATPRIDLPLEAGHLVTVEPGIYFVPAILDSAQYRNQYRDAVDWELLERWRPVGGVRIEDNVLVTAKGPDVLTASIAK
jgi:Xaa-Pro aminopeptidase